MNILQNNYIITSAIAFIVAFATVPLVKKIALRLGLVDKPAARKMHTTNTPLMGGLSIIAGFLISLIFINHVFNFDSSRINQLTGIVLGGIIIFITGIIDDKFGIKVVTKFFFQIVAASIVFYFGVRAHLFIKNIYISYFITVLWTVGITNSFNLLDNMDGLSSGVTVITSVMFFIVAVDQSEYFVAYMSIALFGAALGFLPFNFSPASIFMGDAGSMFLGFVTASIAVTCTYLQKSLLTRLPVIIPLLILSIPLYDTFSVILIRLRKKIPIFKADKRHFSHRLVNLGLSPKYAVMIIYLATICTGMTATLLTHIDRFDAILVLFHNVLIFIIIAILEWAGALKND